MKYFIYSKPLVSVKYQKFIGTLIQVSREEIDGIEARRTVVIGTEEEYNRLDKMMSLSRSSEDDGWCVLDNKRKEKNLIELIKYWRSLK